MRSHMDSGWFYSRSQVTHYFSTRLSSLTPPKPRLRNPFSILHELTRHQWLMFICGFAARAWDVFDYYTVSMTVTELANAFDADIESVSWSMTITMMMRPVGAIVSGVCADRYGRKWPLIINLAFLIVLEMASGFCNTIPQFLGVRSLYGIAMGGVFGPAAATALEDLPYDARGVLSGLFELGSALGNLLAAALYSALVPTTTYGWRSLYWFGAGPPILLIAFRWWLPETHYFREMKAERDAKASMKTVATGQDNNTTGVNSFMKETSKALKENWVLLVYVVFLLAGVCSCFHGGADFYPTFLKNQVQLNATHETLVIVVSQIGSFIGGVTMGYVSSFFGRRLTMITACIFGAAMIPAYILPRNMSLAAGAFFQSFFLGGALGPVPIHLLELSPQAVRSLVVGLAYQLGNLAASATPTIQAMIAQKFPLPPSQDGTQRYSYSIAIAVFLGAGWAYMLVFLFLGPEMSQEERNEEAEAALNRQNLRLEGVSLEKTEDNSSFELKLEESSKEDEAELGIKCIESA